MATTNDAMYTTLVALYPDAGKTLGDLLYAHWSATGLRFRDSLQYDYYVSQNIDGYTVTRKNLMLNPSFETNISGWVFSNATGSLSSTFAHAGTLSVRTQTTVAGFVIVNIPTIIRVTAGQTYTFSAYVRSSVARQCRITVSWFNGGTFLSGSNGSYVTSSTSEWTRCSLTGTAPATATIVYIAFQTAASEIGDLVYWDALLVEEGSTLLPYFDGTYTDTYTGYTVASKSWDGTANGSTSTVSWNPNLTVGDLANKFWSDPDTSVSNLWDELGNNLLLEDGSFMLLEVGNG